MSTLTIRAHFPRGVYQGHQSDRTPDWGPDPARLHAALLQSAGQGTSAEVNGDRLVPSDEAKEALRWMEKNPPSRIEIPQREWLSDQKRFIYREVSSINKTRRTEERQISDGVAVMGHFGYQWDNVPESVKTTIEELCADVGWLGETVSLVLLDHGEVHANYVLDLDSSRFTPGGTYLRSPAEGRTDFLIDLHDSQYAGKRPTKAKDKAKASEKPLSAPANTQNLTQVRYRGVQSTDVPDAPWTHGIFLELSGEDFPKQHQVEMCVALHRALVAAIGDGAPALVTGKTAKDTKPAANHLSIQYLPHSISKLHHLKRHAFMLLVPRETLDLDLEVLAKALSTIKQVWSKNVGRRSVYFSGQTVLTTQFWPEVADGFVRLWKPQSVIIPETRPVKESKMGRKWSVADSGLLSLGFVYKEFYSDEAIEMLRGEALYIALQQKMLKAGARVLRTSRVGGRSARYVHRTPKSVPTQPWSGILDVSQVTGDRTVTALGQSRHLGGGLLVPVDVPLDEYQNMNHVKTNEEV